MKSLITLTFLTLCGFLSAQPNTEVYLTEVNSTVDGKIELVKLRNISNNDGYDNQPSFYDNNTIAFSSTRNTQTDIVLFSIKETTASWITDTPIGSEYSPLKIPGKKHLSAIRLDTDGLQRLYQYNVKNGKSKVLLDGLKVGYHVWYNQDILISSVLVENRMDLVVSNLKDKTNRTLQKNVGRSLHKIPGSDLISFITNENAISIIKSLNPISRVIKEIKSLPILIKDMCWLADSAILIPDKKAITKFNPVTNEFSLFHRFDEEEINEISRISVSPDGKYLAFVSE